jgi:hypothetical protein
VTEMELVVEFPVQFDFALRPMPDVVHWITVSGIAKPRGNISWR